MESGCCNNNDDYHHRRRRPRRHEYELDGSGSRLHPSPTIRGEAEEVACRFDSLPDSNTNGNSTDTFTSDPPVWANSRTSMEMPKIECPIKRVDESREKLLSWLLNPLFKARKKGNNQPHPVQ
eukprot:g9675.t1 g9675   contig4:318255-318623(-)